MTKPSIARDVDNAIRWQTAHTRKLYVEILKPYLQNETDTALCELGRFVSRFNLYPIRHHDNPNAIAVQERELRTKFGRNWSKRFEAVIVRGGRWAINKHGNKTRQFAIVPPIANAVNDGFLRRKRPLSKLERSDGKRPRKTKGAVMNRGQRRKYGDLYNVDGSIEVNIEALAIAESVYSDWHDAAEQETPPTLAPESYRRLRERHNRKHSEKTELQAAHIWLIRIRNYLNNAQNILELTHANGELFPQTFEQRNNKPRFTGTGTSLQTVNKDLRHAALAGCWQYDIECCHHVILLHYAKLAGFDCPALRSMVSNRKAFRERLAESIGHSDTEAIKKALLIIVYGGRFQYVPSWKPDSALLELLGVEGQQALQANPEFSALHSEIKKLFKYIVEHHRPGHGHRGKIQNALGQSLPITYTDEHGQTRPIKQAQKVAFILQGIEAQAMQAMLKASPTAVLPVHDAIITREQVNPADLVAVMKVATGIDFKVEQKQIEAPEWL